MIILVKWLSRRSAVAVRRRYMLENPGKIAYIAKVDLGDPSNARQTWLVIGDN